jgi:hypothetical protein
MTVSAFATAVVLLATTVLQCSGQSSLVVVTDPSNAAINSCLKKTATGPITSKLNKPITNGKFTFYGGGGTGACGIDSGKVGLRRE